MRSQDLGSGASAANGKNGDSALDRTASTSLPVEHAPFDPERRVERADIEIAPVAGEIDPGPEPEDPAPVADGSTPAPDARAPQPRRRRFARRATAATAAAVPVPEPPPAARAELLEMSEEGLEELTGQLRGIEMEGWQAVSEHRGCGFYSSRLADNGLLILPDGSVLDKWEAALSAVNGDETWASYRIEDERVAVLSADCAALTYRASAQMSGETEYVALITSVFLHRGGDWLIALRQETPVHP